MFFCRSMFKSLSSKFKIQKFAISSRRFGSRWSLVLNPLFCFLLSHLFVVLSNGSGGRFDSLMHDIRSNSMIITITIIIIGTNSDICARNRGRSTRISCWCAWWLLANVRSGWGTIRGTARHLSGAKIKLSRRNNCENRGKRTINKVAKKNSCMMRGGSAKAKKVA